MKYWTFELRRLRRPQESMGRWRSWSVFFIWLYYGTWDQPTHWCTWAPHHTTLRLPCLYVPEPLRSLVNSRLYIVLNPRNVIVHAFTDIFHRQKWKQVWPRGRLAAPQRAATLLNFLYPEVPCSLLLLPGIRMYPGSSLSRYERYWLYSAWSVLFLWSITMQLPLALLLASATTAAFALPENERLEGSNRHQATLWRWPSALRFTPANEASQQYDDLNQQPPCRSRSIPRRRRSHP